jgi:hypothetical protein
MSVHSVLHITDLADLVLMLCVKEEERKMFSLAVIPPMMLDARQRSHRFHNENGLITDPLTIHNETMLRVQFWSPEEREIFKEKYVIHPKNFGYIAGALENKVNKYSSLSYNNFYAKFLLSVH